MTEDRLAALEKEVKRLTIRIESAYRFFGCRERFFRSTEWTRGLLEKGEG